MSTATSNPLLQPWDTPFGLPPFDRIRAEHFVPAFEAARAAHLAELDAIAAALHPRLNLHRRPVVVLVVTAVPLSQHECRGDEAQENPGDKCIDELCFHGVTSPRTSRDPPTTFHVPSIFLMSKLCWMRRGGSVRGCGCFVCGST